MAFSKQTIRDIDLAGKRVLLRADYNVPLHDGKITSDYRIKQSLPTIQALLKQGCKIIICSHLGRPTSPSDQSASLRPVARRLEKLLGHDVRFVNDCIGSEAETAAKALQTSQILLLENLRYHAEEEENDAIFAKKLAGLAEVFVQDGFGVVHRAHASTDAITRYLPSVSGLLLEKEVTTIQSVMERPERPLMAVVGGAKISDKIDVLNKLIDVADFVVVGGAMANTFLLAKGIKTGKSLVDKDDIPLAKRIMERAEEKSKKQQFIFYVPQDGVVAKKIDKTARTRIVDWSAHIIAEIENYPKQPPPETGVVESDELVLDVGPFSGAFTAGGIQLANTVIWNGTLGVTETPPLVGTTGPFSQGTELIVNALLGQFGHRPFTLIGGGDTAAYIEEQRKTDLFDHVSTGGGASLELMAGKKLPGIEALKNKE